MASPTVLRFSSASSGMRMPKRSSQATTTSTIVSESTSRSFWNVASRVTLSAGTPETSSRTSARPVRTSVWGIVLCLLLVGVFVRSGHVHDLGGGREAGAEADEQGAVATGDLAELDEPGEGEGHRRGTGVAAVADVAGHGYRRGQPELRDDGLGDAQVGL